MIDGFVPRQSHIFQPAYKAPHLCFHCGYTESVHPTATEKEIEDLRSPMTIKQWCDEAWANAKAHGFKEDDVPLKIALMHSELSEALEEWRNGHGLNEFYRNEGSPKPEGFPVELADLVIRVFSFCGAHGIDIENMMAMKHHYNIGRPHMHGGKLA